MLAALKDLPEGMSGNPVAVPATTAVKLESFLKAHPTVKVAFVDCQSEGENAGRQFKGALRLYSDTFQDAKRIIMERFQEKSDHFRKSMLGADLVIFYCYAGSTRSPAAMKTYCDYRKTLKDVKDQQILLLTGGMGTWLNKIKDGKRVDTWNLRGSTKKVSPAAGDEPIPDMDDH